jgi:hypothetical protein
MGWLSVDLGGMLFVVSFDRLYGWMSNPRQARSDGRSNFVLIEMNGMFR